MPHSSGKASLDRPLGGAILRISRWQACQDIGRIFYYSDVSAESLAKIKKRLSGDPELMNMIYTACVEP